MFSADNSLIQPIQVVPAAPAVPKSAGGPLSVTNLSTNLGILFPPRSPKNPFSTGSLTSTGQISSGTERAEALNAQAMRDYQIQFEKHLANPRTTAAPALYPTRPQRILAEGF